jgi:hypothetical protein
MGVRGGGEGTGEGGGEGTGEGGGEAGSGATSPGRRISGWPIDSNLKPSRLVGVMAVRVVEIAEAEAVSDVRMLLTTRTLAGVTVSSMSAALTVLPGWVERYAASSVLYASWLKEDTVPCKTDSRRTEVYCGKPRTSISPIIR